MTIKKSPAVPELLTASKIKCVCLDGTGLLMGVGVKLAMLWANIRPFQIVGVGEGVNVEVKV